MSEAKMKTSASGSFRLSKWYLDIIGDNGETLIMYSAMLEWHGLSIPYVSWLHYDGSDEVLRKSGFRAVKAPQIKGQRIVWHDPGCRISGVWESNAGMIQARLYDSGEGSADWYCHQPLSKASINFHGKILQGNGYVEQLVLTVPPWKIPMDELRWGHFCSGDDCLVWIEIKETEKRQWLWLNGEATNICRIEDDIVCTPERNLVLELERNGVLESEQKIHSLAQGLLCYLPGINRLIPARFLRAEEVKWISRANLRVRDKCSAGRAVHERVTFKG